MNRVYRDVDTKLSIPRDIISWCNSNFKYEYVETLNFEVGKYITVSISSKFNSKPRQFDDVIGIINSMVSCFGIKHSINIRILPTPIRKIWNNHDKLTQENVNTGYTEFLSSGPTFICVFRSEELYKVLIHELIHGLELVNHNTQLNTRDHLYEEAVVEAWATIINCIRLSTNNVHFKIPNMPKGYDSLFQTHVFKSELTFSLKQSKRLLYHHKCISAYACKIALPKTPSVFSYYIIKTAFLSTPSKFVRLFWWSNLEKCCVLNEEDVKLFIDPYFDELLQKSAIYKGKSMRMTLDNSEATAWINYYKKM